MMSKTWFARSWQHSWARRTWSCRLTCFDLCKMERICPSQATSSLTKLYMSNCEAVWREAKADSAVCWEVWSQRRSRMTTLRRAEICQGDVCAISTTREGFVSSTSDKKKKKSMFKKSLKSTSKRRGSWKELWRRTTTSWMTLMSSKWPNLVKIWAKVSNLVQPVSKEKATVRMKTKKAQIKWVALSEEPRNGQQRRKESPSSLSSSSSVKT